MSTNARAQISVLIDSLIGYYSLEPVIHELCDRGAHLHLYCVPAVAERIAALASTMPQGQWTLVPFVPPKRVELHFHRLLRQLATRPSFSFQYRLFCDPRQFPGDWRYWTVAQLARLSPGLPHGRVNGMLTRALRPLVSNPFATRRILTASRSAFPHLLCARGAEVTTVLESWDHPVKWPVGHRSAAVFTWNRDLATDWLQYQGDREVHVAYPFKLRYWLERNLPNRDQAGRKIAVYAAATSSMSYINDLHTYELVVIDAVCEATRRAGWQLMIKPKPNGKLGDFDGFAARYPHVRIGAYREADNPSDYYLDDQYNRQREAELEQCDLVINAATTFGLDAALGGLPCLQLDVRACTEFKGLAEGQTNHHIARYLLDDPNACLVARPGTLVEQLAAYLANPDRRAWQQRDRLRRWVSPSVTMSRAAGAIADRMGVHRGPSPESRAQ